MEYKRHKHLIHLTCSEFGDQLCSVEITVK